ncbi:MAG: hypothetical protein C0616_00155 [Desulfuromonas sp.]|nr:MAG: hypothetical protein C0616_00155 [Desulfuromonas sp.]
MFMSRCLTVFSICLLLLFGGMSVVSATPPDDYLGDSSIYTGVPSQRPTPNVLFVIDTSRSTLSRAPGVGYDSATTYSIATGFDTDQLYVGDQFGTFSPSRALGSVKLTNNGTDPYVFCNPSYTVPDPMGGPDIAKNTDVQAILAANGTYSGAGTNKFPNLATDGDCLGAPQGRVYATGNYLNYTYALSVVEADAVIIQHTYNWCRNARQCFTETGNFLLTADLINAGAAQEPGVGSEWELYWSSTTEPATYPDDDSDGIWDGVDGWDPATYQNYYLPASADAVTQREAFYSALEPVIRGASGAVNLGFLAYNPNNQGAVVGQHMAFYGDDPSALIDALPQGDEDGDGDIEDEDPSVIASGPNRPQAEALYDAGYYFMVDNGSFTPVYRKKDGALPSQQSINLTASDQIPADMINICGYNHVILLTNGLPNQDGDPALDLGDYDNDEYGNEGTYGAGTHYLDDVAYYLHNVVDINGDAKPGDVTVHTILAFQTEDELIKNTAEDGGGYFYNVQDTNGLTKALQEILASIVSETDTAFVAPVVPASSTNRTISSNKVYLGLFKPQSNEPWHGNLKKYKVNSDNELLDSLGNRATDDQGDFVYSQSYWGTGTIAGQTKIMSADGPRNTVPAGYDPEDPTAIVDLHGGDGGIVNAGGAGGTLQARDFTTNPRKIYTYLTPANSGVASADSSLIATQNLFAVSNTDITYNTTLDVPDATVRNKLINYVHGYAAFSTTPTAKRNWIFGDILHSKPLVFNYTNYTDANETTCFPSPLFDPTDSDPVVAASNGTTSFNSSVIFVGANDGMLHAIRDCDGEELWAFVPPSLLNHLKWLPQSGHEYYVDAPASAYVHDFDNDGAIEPGAGDKVILVMGLRRGGGKSFLTPNEPRGSYFAIDVTKPNSPVFLGEVDNTSTNLGEMGETWSQPRLHKIMDGTTEKLVFFVGAGYDTNEDRRWGNTQDFPTSNVSSPVNPFLDTDTTVLTNDGDPGVSNAGVTSAGGGSQLNPKGRGLFIIELATLNKDGNGDYTPDFSNGGTVVWKYTYAEDSDMTFSIPSDIAVIDWDGDGFADRAYAGDTGGRVWCFEMPIDRVTDPANPTGDKSAWTGRKIFNGNQGYTGSFDSDGVMSSSADGSLGKKFFYRPSISRIGPYAALYFGSGDRVHPLNLASNDRLYMLIDRGQGAASDDAGTTFDETTAITEQNLVDVTENELQNSSSADQVAGVLDELYDDANLGWYIRLQNPGEKMLAPPVVFFGQVFYTTYAPLVGSVSGCEVGNLGVSRLYHLTYRTGEAAYDYDSSNNADDTSSNTRADGDDGEVLKKSDRVRVLGEGIPSGIVTLMDASGKVTMMISASNRVGAYDAPDAKLITPVYWIQWNE